MTKKELTLLLINQDNHCHYCGTEVYLYPEIRSRLLNKGEIYPSNMATIEHLYDRYDPRRYQMYENNEDKVLCCYKCNHNRGIKRVDELKDLHTERSLLGQKREKGVPRNLYFSTFRNFEGGATL